MEELGTQVEPVPQVEDIHQNPLDTKTYNETIQLQEEGLLRTGGVLNAPPGSSLASGDTPVIRQYLAAASPATWTKPAGLKYVIVEVQGAGGTGGTGASGGGGGGGGAYSRKVISASSCSATETITIGAAGVGSGNTSFGSLLLAPNGADASSGTGGAGGTASGGDVNISGGTGQSSTASRANSGGHGGCSVLGSGGVGGGFSNDTAGAYNGENAHGYGGGGGGGGAASDGSPTGSAGEGTAGIVIVTEYF